MGRDERRQVLLVLALLFGIYLTVIIGLVAIGMPAWMRGFAVASMFVTGRESR